MRSVAENGTCIRSFRRPRRHIPAPMPPWTPARPGCSVAVEFTRTPTLNHVVRICTSASLCSASDGVSTGTECRCAARSNVRGVRMEHRLLMQRLH